MRFKSESRAVHGGRGEYLTGEHGEILDFSANINPYPPEIDLSIPTDALNRYPDDEYSLLKETIAGHHGCKPDQITVGNGSVEILRTLCHTVLQPGTPFFVPPHTFSEYELSARLAGGIRVDSDSEAILSFFCNPDNPSGILLSREEMTYRISKIKELDSLLCVDEAFIDLADPSESLVGMRIPQLFIMRSLTKSFAIPGIRFGYGIGDPDLIASMEVMRPPWTVNAYAEHVVLSAFSKFNELEQSRQRISTERIRLTRAITNHGFSCSPAQANYLLIDTGIDAKTVTNLFLKKGILVRDCTSFGLPHSIRIAVRTIEENSRFIEELDRVFSCMPS